MCSIQRLRTLDDCVNWLKEQDPGSRITKGMVKEIAVSGLVPCIWRGRKVLIDIDALPEAISAWVELQKQTPTPKTEQKLKIPEYKEKSGKYGKIRAI